MNALTSFSSDDTFAAFLPAALRDRAANMSWTTFTDTFCRTSGPIRLGNWTTSRARGGRTTFEATFGIAANHTASNHTASNHTAGEPAYIRSATATSFGPIDALTSMLYDAGFHIEITSFHQQTMGTGDTAETATFVLCEYDGRHEWSMAIGHDSAESSIRAIIGAANMLHA
ncbi:alpha-isopropylmalate synthase regulatory domain-containing protein [Rhodococcus sp. G-MC3]|uniref:alpha-isopropylmalate synthase regulatory domain-containing protein n=1 Tax=Rhodococcus sp. G-MC3 TaxID=3046209 RepID=UPI0024B94E2C|nr:alpha-isopropylmalate synthase regulatory domain-containing protein [Rhodococcus sp. G-MC3]MDJ0393748.1 alpha-isopropylmalate synthase regulatory domain-containing protein [Rhodococcus sp. G-MC3]